MKYGVLIPAYNEEPHIASVAAGALAQCPEVFVVDDGSTDSTLERARSVPGLTVLANGRNLGLAETMKRGFRYALDNRYDAVIKMDGDGQMNAEKLPLLFAKYDEGKWDLVMANFNPDTPWMVKKDIWIYSRLLWLATGVSARDVVSEYRLFSRRAMQAFLASPVIPYGTNFAVIDLLRAGCRIGEISGGVNYNFVQRRPAHLNILIDCRVQFVRALWRFEGWRARGGVILAAVVLLGLLILNLTVGYRYNSWRTKSTQR